MYSCAYIMDTQLKSNPYIVEHLLYPGLYVLAGASKIGKSWLALDLCLSVAEGKPFLKYETHKSQVLYLALEDSLIRLQDRLYEFTDEPAEGLHFSTLAKSIGGGLEQQLDNAKKKLMELLELMKYRRSIRKYTDKQIPLEDLQKIIEAGEYAPNAGGGQRSIIVAVRNKRLAEQIGILNLSKFDRSRLIGGFVSKEQPSVIDDKNIKNGFYGAPCVCIIFTPKNFLYAVPDAFCCAVNMVLEATELGIALCNTARAFVLLGYCEGDYPQSKPRRDGRVVIVDEDRLL